MDTEKCRVLLKTIEEGSFSAASESLGYTISGVSRMMSALEQEVGFPLLSRGRHGVLPTADCLKILPAIRELVRWGEQCRQLSAEICGLETGTVTIGTSYHVFYRWIAKLVAAFKTQYPNILVNIVEGNSTTLCDLIDGCKIDLAIISKREGPHPWIPLMVDPMVALVPVGHPLAEGPTFPFSAFNTETYIVTYANQDTDSARTFARNGIEPNKTIATSDSFATYYMVEAGLGVSLNNTLNVKGFTGAVKVLPLEPPQQVEIGIATLKELSPSAQKFVAMAKNHPMDV